MRLMALSLLAGGVSGWAAGITDHADILAPDPLVARWSSGSNTSYTDGLKGGITWAFDPALCDRLLPLFPEESLWRGPGYFFEPEAWNSARPSRHRAS